jgi:hypothetical protein
MDNGSRLFVSAIGIAILLLFLFSYLDSTQTKESIMLDPPFVQEVDLIYENGTTLKVCENVINTKTRQVAFGVIVSNTSIKEVRIWTLQQL